jgi:hypothetical protein
LFSFGEPSGFEDFRPFGRLLMESYCRGRLIASFVLILVLAVLLNGLSAQGLQGTPYGSSNVLRSGGLDLAPSNPFGMPGGSSEGSDSIHLSSGMFPQIFGPVPNLQLGYLYSFGNDRVDTGRFTLDYLLPVTLGANSAVFGEVHGEFADFWKTLQALLKTTGGNTSFNGFAERTDISLGGGYRTLLDKNTLLGVNGFYDATKLGDRWYGSGGVGIEYAALFSGSDAVDISFNWYGNLFNRNVLVNAFRRGPSNFDFEAGYSHELFDQGPDLRLHATGYRFSAGEGVYGWRAGAELKSRNGMFSLKYEAGEDKVNSAYHTIGGYVNTGLRLEKLLSGESPFTMPEPIFRSPRNLRRLLTTWVRRDYRQPAAVVVSKSTGGPQAGPCDGFNTITVTAPNTGNYRRWISGNNTWTNNGWLRTAGGTDRMFFAGGGVPEASICPQGVTRILVTLTNLSNNNAAQVQLRVSIGRAAGGQFVRSRGSERSAIAGTTGSGNNWHTFEIIAPNMQRLLRAFNISPDRVRVQVRHNSGLNRRFRVTPADVVIQFNYR